MPAVKLGNKAVNAEQGFNDGANRHIEAQNHEEKDSCCFSRLSAA